MVFQKERKKMLCRWIVLVGVFFVSIYGTDVKESVALSQSSRLRRGGSKNISSKEKQIQKAQEIFKTQGEEAILKWATESPKWRGPAALDILVQGLDSIYLLVRKRSLFTMRTILIRYRNFAQEKLLKKILPLVGESPDEVQAQTYDTLQVFLIANPRLARKMEQELSKYPMPKLYSEARGRFRFVEATIQYLDEVLPTSSTPQLSFGKALELLHKEEESVSIQLEEAQKEATRRVAQLLHKIPERKQEVMLLLLNKQKPLGLRRHLAMALGSVQADDEVLNFLINRAKDGEEDITVRREAMRSLVFLAQPTRLPELNEIYKEARRRIRTGRFSSQMEDYNWMLIEGFASNAIESAKVIQEATLGSSPFGSGGVGTLSPIHFRPTPDGTVGPGGPMRGPVSDGVTIKSEGSAVSHLDLQVLTAL